MEQAQKWQWGPLQQLLAAFFLSFFVGSIVLSTILLGIAAWWLLTAPWSPVGWSLGVFWATLALIPLWERNGPLAEKFITFICSHAESYFPITVICADGAIFSESKTYVVGLEPHSALPTAMPSTFSLQSRILPKGLQGRTHGLASSIVSSKGAHNRAIGGGKCVAQKLLQQWQQHARVWRTRQPPSAAAVCMVMCFQIPFVRQMYWWIGIRPITRHYMKKLLHHHKNVVLVPGGVQECLYMQHNSETAFLKNRKGFIRIALQTGSAVVPCFAFGQSKALSWYRPGPPLVSDAFVQMLSRRIGFVPLMMWGRWGTPAPINAPMTVVLGKPIEMPKQEHPSDATLQKCLDQYIAGMQEIFEKYKATAGYPDYKLHIL